MSFSHQLLRHSCGPDQWPVDRETSSQHDPLPPPGAGAAGKAAGL